MTQEEKAKRYDEALERAKNYREGHTLDVNPQSAMEYVFPELADSEDEKIREQVVYAINQLHVCECTKNKLKVWLEKQGKETSYENIFPNTEDGVRRRSTIQVLEYARSLDAYNQYGKESINKDIAWLEEQGKSKSYSWKPTKEQFEALDYAYNCYLDTERGNYYEGVLKSLIDDLYRLEKQGEQKSVEQSFWEKCNNCEYFDGYDLCLHKNNFGSVTDELKENCKNNKFFIEKQGEPNEKPTKEQVWDYCNKISHEWWQIAMDKWNTLTDEEKTKYNQFIGFNDFSDTLMNITAGALFQLIDTGKLEYEEGSLLLEKPDDTPKHVEFMTVPEKSQREQKPTCLSDNLVHNVKFAFPFKAKVKSNGKIVTILNGQLSMDCKEWIKYQSDVEDGYTVYAPKDLINIEYKPADKLEPKFKIGDTMRTKQETVEGVNGGIPVIISIDEEYYHCNNELIAIKDQEEYEYPPMNRKQNTIDNIGPKFKVGDWISQQYMSSPFVIVDIDIKNNLYILNDIEGNNYKEDIDFTHDRYHHWTIKDANDGDVLVNNNDIYLFDGTVEDGIYPFAYCGIIDGDFEIYDRKIPFTHSKFSYPATKEQCDLLFQKMKEANYKWDAEKKELKKIEQISAWSEKIKGLNELETYILSLVPDRSLDAIKVDAKNIKHIINKEQQPAEWSRQSIIDALTKWLTEKIVPLHKKSLDGTINEREEMFKAALLQMRSFVNRPDFQIGKDTSAEWSEEDEKVRYEIEVILANTDLSKFVLNYTFANMISWLKSLKDRIQLQPKQEWSEDDNKMLNNVIQRIKDLDHYWNKPTDEKMIDWLKSLKPHWKPSEYDISLLEELARNIRNNVRPFCSEVSALEELIKNIKNI